MTLHIVHGAVLRCSMGLAPSSLQVVPVGRAFAAGRPAATIADHRPLANVLSFGMCRSPANPAVVAATAAALGVFTPAPCLPATPAPWVPGAPTVPIGGVPALTHRCRLNCLWLGVIEVANPAQANVHVT
jgi:hypothetical protein